MTQSSVTLSPAFLGSISTLGWLSTYPSHPAQPPHPHTLTAPPTLSLHLSAVIAALPMPLSLSRASTLVSDGSESDQEVGVASWRGDGVSHVRVEWGPLVCQCLNAYWNCLLCLMKHDNDWIIERGMYIHKVMFYVLLLTRVVLMSPCSVILYDMLIVCALA